MLRASGLAFTRPPSAPPELGALVGAGAGCGPAAGGAGAADVRAAESTSG
jgi:hypothetical protein